MTVVRFIISIVEYLPGKYSNLVTYLPCILNIINVIIMNINKILNIINVNITDIKYCKILNIININITVIKHYRYKYYKC